MPSDARAATAVPEGALDSLAAGRGAQALAALGRRSLSGTIGHFVVMGFAQWRMAGSDGLPRGLLGVVFVACLVARLAGYRDTARLRGSLRRRWLLVSIGSIGPNVVWASLVAAVQIRTGASVESIVMAFITCGVASGAVTALAPSSWLQRTAMTVLILPVVVLGAFGLGLGSFAVLDALFLIFMLALGSVAHRDYWQSVHANAMLARHAEAAQRASVAADETNRQLRAQIAHGRQMEVDLRQAQKLEAIGRLAAGIAHEINTPLQFVSDSCQFLLDGSQELGAGIDELQRIVDEQASGRLDANRARAELARVSGERELPYLREQLPEAAARALEGLGRVAKIVTATKAFAYPDRKERALVDINKSIESTLVIANNETKYVADVHTELATLPPVLCHGGEINQVVLNIIVNAAHAIRDVVHDTGARGVIRVKTWADGDLVRIEISDTGTGIPPDILDKIYEPFFTTKPVGAGTGQGLAIARSVIVDRHGGALEVASRPGAGATFTIALPVRGAGAGAIEAPADGRRPSPARAGSASLST